MRALLLAIFLASLSLPGLAEARSRGDSTGWRQSRSCHCERYLDPRYAPRGGPYRGGASHRY